MDTLDSLMRKGYRLYNVNMKVNSTLRHYLRVKKGLQVDYHESLKIITVKDAREGQLQDRF